MDGLFCFVLSMNELVLSLFSSGEVKKNKHFLVFHQLLIAFFSVGLLVVFLKFLKFFLCVCRFFYFLQLLELVLVYQFSFRQFLVFNTGLAIARPVFWKPGCNRICVYVCNPF